VGGRGRRGILVSRRGRGRILVGGRSLGLFRGSRLFGRGSLLRTSGLLRTDGEGSRGSARFAAFAVLALANRDRGHI
jgi:hypothetical protein